MNRDLELLLAFLRPIHALLVDDSVTEIMGNPDGSWWYERGGKVQRAHDIHFDTKSLHTGLEVIANRLGRKLDTSHPILNVQLPDGSRLAAVRYTMTDLIERGALTGDLAAYLRLQIEAGRTMLISGGTGSGKTTVLENIREGAERNGYTVEGFAPSSRAAGQLREAGIEASTLQSFLAKGGGQDGPDAPRHLYMLDESSLASTRQMRAFLDKIGPEDRVLVIGDTRQHQGVDAGRPFQQMQEAGMRTSELSQIMRQKDPELLKAVEHLAKGETAVGVKMLAEQGRVTEIANGNERIAAIAKDYVAKPENTLIVSPDNRSRVAINQAVRVELQAKGTLAKESQEFSTLAHRSDMTGADRTWAARYSPGDVLQYNTGSKANGIERGSYATVQAVDAKNNTVSVQREDGVFVSYDPKRLKGVNVYREVQREIAEGERIQFTTNTGLVANRDLGTVTKIEPHRFTVRMNGPERRVVTFDPTEMRHFDHGYAVTSHSAQGLTTGRVIANMDGETARSLINSRLAYVAISRASEDARIYTNDATTIGQRLATEVSKTAAVEFRPPAERVYTPAEIKRHYAPIRKALEPEDAAQFRWKAETGSIQTYQHTETGRNIHIDGKGQFYSQDGNRTSQDAALDRAMPVGRAPSQNELDNSFGLGR